MAVLEIIQGADNPILRKKSVAIKKIDAKLKKLVKDMSDTLFKAKGIGLAAPQVGQNIRVILALLNVNTPQQTLIEMVNPEILESSEEKETAEEGCLSLPGIYGNVERSKSITVHFQTLKNQKLTLHLKGLNARIVQHEVDHIDGVLIVDRFSQNDFRKV